MLPKINRLKADRDFKNVFKNGKTVENRFFRVKFLKNQENFSRFGFIVSNKISKKAVSRNLLKRRLREICRRLSVKNSKTGFDMAVWPKTSSLTLKYGDLYNYLWELISKI